MCIKGKEVCQRLAGEKKDLVKHGPETVSTDVSIIFQFQCISEHYLLHIFIKGIQLASRLDDSWNKFITQITVSRNSNN